MSIGDYFTVSTTLTPWWSNFFGVSGFCIYLVNYTLVTFRVVTSQGIVFFLANMLGAGLVLISLTHDFNLGSALIQIFWLILGTIAVFIRVRARLTAGRVEVVGAAAEETVVPQKPWTLPTRTPLHTGVFVSRKFGPHDPMNHRVGLGGTRDHATRESP